MPDGSLFTDDYLAEFNDGVIGGDVTGTNGYFNGLLTADAINAVGNITIRGGAVAVTTTAYVEDTGYRWDDDNRYRDVATLAFNTPPLDTKGGFFRLLWQFKTIDGKGDNAKFPCQFRITDVSRLLWESPRGTQAMYQYAGQYFSILISDSLLPGLHTFHLQYRIGPATTNAYPRFYNVRGILDYARK